MSDTTADSPGTTCDDLPRVICFHDEKVTHLRASLPGEAELRAAAAFLKAAGHAGLLSVLALLAEEECCVCDLAHTLEMPVSTASQHLRRLRAGGLVQSRKEGKMVFYSIEDCARELLNRSLAHGEEL